MDVGEAGFAHSATVFESWVYFVSHLLLVIGIWFAGFAAFVRFHLVIVVASGDQGVARAVEESWFLTVASVDDVF